MNSRPDDHQSSPGDADLRERLTAVYAAFNHAIVNQRDERASLIDDVSWVESVGDSTEWAAKVGVAIAEHATDSTPETVDHLQALPEGFVEEDETVVVSGAYVGTTDDGARFDVSFVHSYDLHRGAVLEQTSASDDAVEQQVADSYGS